jgi:hypothetical protein
MNATRRSHYPWERDPILTLSLQGVEWAPGRVWTGAENLALTEIRTQDRVARSMSLHRLRYPGPRYRSVIIVI